LYATDKTTQYTYISAAEEKGYNVLLMDGQLDNHIIGLLEQKLEKISFVRVDADIPERLIVKSDVKDAGLTPLQTDIMTTIIRSQIPEVDKTQFIVSFAALRPEDAPATITQNEFMRRMKEMAAMQPGGGFYGQLPDSYELVVNTEQPVIKKIIELATSSLEDEVSPVRAEIELLNNEITASRKESEDKKDQAPDLSEKENKVADLRKKEEDIVKKYASEQPKIRQIVDLALLQSHLLNGESLNEFIKRSISLLS
ncbi:MAG: molecular chaperone HtpG, partial [Muribaculaceae bacterium]|nr:molecular chaperone HtpG [Muribaculaceae bacterium]